MKDCVTEEIIEETNEETKLDGLLKKMQRMNSPGYLHTVSLNELYENVYESRPPVIDGLLYAGAYILAGAPKIGKSFLVAQLAYHVSTGQPLWGYDVHQGTVLYLALEDDFRRLQDGCRVCSASRARTSSTFPSTQRCSETALTHSWSAS